MSDEDRNFKHEWKRSALRGLRGKNGADLDELSLFEWYSAENEKVTAAMTREAAEICENGAASKVDSINDSALLATEYYKKRARYAAVIYLASLLEAHLSRACQSLTDYVGKQNIDFRPDELAGDKWSKSKKFLERYGKFSFPDKEWGTMQSLIFIRNILVHENGSATSASKADIKRIIECAGLSIIHEEILVDAKFIDDSVSAFRSLVDYIGTQLDGTIDRKLSPQPIN